MNSFFPTFIFLIKTLKAILNYASSQTLDIGSRTSVMLVSALEKSIKNGYLIDDSSDLNA